MDILLTGSNGTLGSFLYKELSRYPDINIIANTRSVCDLSNLSDINNLYGYLNPSIVVHCAAYTDVKNSQYEKIKVFNDNVVASINLIDFSIKKHSKFIFISTDFVFDGTKGFYKPNDQINPQTVYAKTKASIELALSCYDNSLIIRTSFFGENFPFDKACTDRFTSKDYIDIIGPMITQKILSDQRGITHVGTDRKSFYELASRRKKVNGSLCMSSDEDFGKDYSFFYD